MNRLWQRIKRAFGGKVETRGAWAGAQMSRLNDFAFSTIQSANQEIRYEGATLRGRARDLARNNPNAKRFLKMLEQNVVGHRGIRLECQVMLKTGKNAGQPDEPTNDLIEAAWKDWGRPGQCEVTRKHSWVSFQQQVIRTVARDGEAFVRIVESYPNDYGFALQLLDADQIDATYTTKGGEREPRIEQGVEIDRWGAAVAYHVWTSHPGDPNRQRQRERIPAAQILHLYVEDRAGQSRGVTWFAPVLVALRHIDGLVEAAVVNARAGAAKMGFIVSGEDAPAPNPDLPADQQWQPMEATPGVIDRLAHGESFQGWDPKYPDGEFGPFTLALLRWVSGGLNVSYMGLTGDLTSANYSSARVGLLDERDGWRSLQTWFSEHLHDVVYRRWLRIASLTPRLRLPNYDLTKYEAVCWRARGWDWVDPKNDLEAAGMAIDRGITSLTEIVAERGGELGDVLRTKKAETDLADELGVELLTGIVPPPTTLEPAPDPAPKDETAAQDRQAVLALGRSIDGAVKWQAQREAPTPIINVHPPAITVESPVVNIAPAEVRIENHPPAITVEAADIRVEAPVTNLELTVPEIRIPDVIVPEIRVPDVIVPEIRIPDVIVHNPRPSRRRHTTFEKDARGVITGSITTDLPETEG